MNAPTHHRYTEIILMANAKKRRRAVSKIRLKNRANHHQKFIKKHIQNQVVAEKWEPTASASENLSKVGIELDPNKTHKRQRKLPALEAPLEELFGAFFSLLSLIGRFAHVSLCFAEPPSHHPIPFFQSKRARAGVPPPEKLGRNPRRRVMSEEEQRYIMKLLARHGDDFKVRFPLHVFPLS